jgi:hypothetical protein
MTGCAQPVFVGGSSEGNNSSGSATAAIEIRDPAFEGGIALAAYDFHCEINKGADWYLRQTYDSSASATRLTDAVWYFSACDFARSTDSAYTTNCIKVDWETEAKIGRQFLSLNACVFKRYLTYTPNAGHQYILFTGTQQESPRNVYVSPDCIFDDAVETPAWVSYGSQPFIELTRTGNQTVSDVTETVWTAATEVINWGAFTQSGGWVTIAYAGVYQIDGFLQFTTLPSGQKIGRIKRDVLGAVTTIVPIATQDVTGGLDSVQASAVCRLTAGDKISVSLYHSTGGSMNIAGSGSQSRLHIRKISG